MSLIDDIKRDREMMVGTGTFGQWWGDEETRTVTLKDNILITVADVEDEIDTRRIARVPEMETALMVADDHLVAALKAISEGYARPDISHEDFRVKAAHFADDALASYREATK